MIHLDPLTTEQEYVSTRDAAVRSRTEVTLAMVDVYRSLMGAPDTAATTLLNTL
ncbi:RND efflux system, outer membrane lipoprotein CmeC [Nitrincola lacisaponensis]|uniref:RND efflux system, outer membrane lipoprotein CmeC n=1 Tax=Nitrincola lacisaponensis TaxID=267850 RepID=A0A063Y8I7_9GAMM|nr:RND efflux system, outer membrane lipoprotein CmeC [Nitrincola lacisaponensis]